MGGRKCCIDGCPSFSIRSEDRGVTFHRFPIQTDIRKVWLAKCRMNAGVRITKGTFVCSRHFRKSDFQIFKGTKYLLKQGAVPSIFSNETPIKKLDDIPENEEITSDSGNQSILNRSNSPVTGDTVKKGKLKTSKRSASAEEIPTEVQKKTIRKSVDSALSKNKTVDLPSPEIKTEINTSKEIPPINFVPGTKIEAQDFNKAWHTAKIIEVDYDDREVLVQFDKNKTKSQAIFDEWISMDSSRIRPVQVKKPITSTFEIGERCTVKLSENKKLLGTVKKVLEAETFEIILDDGQIKMMKSNQISKLKKKENLNSPVKTETKIVPDIPSIAQSTQSQSSASKINEYIPPKIDWDSIPDPPEGEWSCHWYNDAPVGQESILLYSEGRLVKTYIVKDNRLPSGYIKHLFQRSGLLGKWDTLIVSPTGKVYRSKLEMKQHFNEIGETYNPEIYDFSLHKRRAKEMGLWKYSADYFAVAHIQLEKKSLKKSSEKNKLNEQTIPSSQVEGDVGNVNPVDNFIMIGSVKVQIIDNLFRCPDEKCNKNFRKENHLQIHIKHYHKELGKMLGVCPNMTDLAYLRTMGTPTDEPLPKNHLPNNQFFEKVHQHEMQNKHHRKSINTIPESLTTSKEGDEVMDVSDIQPVISDITETPHRGRYTLLEEALTDENVNNTPVKKEETEKPMPFNRTARPPTVFHRSQFGTMKRKLSKVQKITKHRIANPEEVQESFTEYDETRQSFGSPESGSIKRQKILNQTSSIDSMHESSSQNNSNIAEPSQSPKYIQEDGEVIKIVRMRQEEIINCICGVREEDGLMIQCELCLCWQHGICNNIERESHVPEKYICIICRNPQHARSSLKYKHDQEWMYEGRLPTLTTIETLDREKRYQLLKQSHTLTGNLLDLKKFLHSLKIKIKIAEKKEHPKMYLWSKKWETSPINTDVQGVVPLNKSENEKFRSDQLKAPTTTELGTQLLCDDEKVKLTESDVEMVKKEEDEIKEEKNDELLSGILRTPGGTNIDLLKESQSGDVDIKKIPETQIVPNIPMPEAPIDSSECQARLLEHIQKQQTLALNRLNVIEEQIMALESTNEISNDKLENDNFTRTKQTIQMLIRDLITMRKIATVNSSEVYGTFI